MTQPDELPAFTTGQIEEVLADPLGSTTADTLLATWATRHLVLLRATLEAASERCPHETRQAGLVEAATILGELDATHHATVVETVRAPWVGLWATRCLRRLADESDDGSDMALDLAYLGAVALAVAITADESVELTVPCRGGRVVVPGHGTLEGMGGDDRLIAVVTSHDGQVSTVGQVDGELVSLQPRNSFRLQTSPAAGARPTAPVLLLDDFDTWRAASDFPVTRRLSESQAASWRQVIADGWRTLTMRHPEAALLVASMVRVVVPLVDPDTDHASSATSEDALGAVYCTLPRDARSLAATLIHEAQHTHLYLIQALTRLLGDDGRLFYSPYRADPRPLGGVLHGVFAGVALARFWHREIVAGDISYSPALEFERAWQQAESALDVLRASDSLTRHGHLVTDHLEHLLERLRTDRSSDTAQVVARLTVEDHAITWRLRHLAPSASTVDDLVATLRHGYSPVHPCPDSLLRGSVEESLTDDRRLLLAYRPDPGENSATARRSDSRSIADQLLLDGRHAEAAGMYELCIAEGDRSDSTWAGLALAASAVAGQGRRTLSTHPEVVRQLHLSIWQGGAADPAHWTPRRLAAWLDGDAPPADPEGARPPGRR